MDQTTATHREPERRVRVNIDKNSRGYNVETTAEITWFGGSAEDGVAELRALLRTVGEAAREEVQYREAIDGAGI